MSQNQIIMTRDQFNPAKLPSVKIKNNTIKGQKNILTNEAFQFLTQLHVLFNPKRLELLAQREELQNRFDLGHTPKFLTDTQAIRDKHWKAAPTLKELEDRRVEITGPVDRKTIINGLNSGANVFMADFEDATSPTWSNVIHGQFNLKDAIQKTISYSHPTNNKEYKLNKENALLFVRPRGWHLEEKNVRINSANISASLFDFGLYFFHNAKELVAQKSAPYFYLPKLENHLEARLWNDVFVFSQDYLGLPQSTIKATVLIETITASFEMDEILYELREHSAGLNCGRWDYIFSFIKKFRNQSGTIFPNRDQVTMEAPFMKAYTQMVVHTCHKRGVHAIGGMAAQIPIKGDKKANTKALNKVIQDKTREVQNGHDGTWVAHPGLIKPVLEIFNKHMPAPNQINAENQPKAVQTEELLKIPIGSITESGIRNNISIAILYLEKWLNGTGAVALNHLMEDAATAEIARTQLWQWYHNGAVLEDERQLSPQLFDQLICEEYKKIIAPLTKEALESTRFKDAKMLIYTMIINSRFTDFLTTEAYKILEQ